MKLEGGFGDRHIVCLCSFVGARWHEAMHIRCTHTAMNSVCSKVCYYEGVLTSGVRGTRPMNFIFAQHQFTFIIKVIQTWLIFRVY